MAALPKMIPLADAVKKVRGATLDDLRLLVEKGKIKGASINGEIFVDTKTLPTEVVRKEDLPEYKKFRHLKGIGISLGESARKYGIPHRTVNRWKTKGLVKQLGVEKNRILVDEQDIAYCAFFYHTYDNSQGQWMFDLNGAPRIKEKQRLIPTAGD